MRYDAAIIGAGANGLAAAALLARSGASVFVIERSETPAPRLATRTFHPGFRASPYADAWAPIPTDLFWSLDLARRGAVMRPCRRSRAVWPGNESELGFGGRSAGARLLRAWTDLGERARLRAMAEADDRRPGMPAALLRAPQRPAWPGADVIGQALGDVLAASVSDPRERAHVAAIALEGRAADPWCDGSVAHLLAPAAGDVVMGGSDRLGDALAAAARDAGAVFAWGVEANELERRKSHFVIALADGRDIEARKVISTLDVKRTFLSLFPWQALPKPVLHHAGQFRMAGASARVLIALERAPGRRDSDSGSVHVAPDLREFAAADAAFREGTLAADLPLVLRMPSALDPGLAPPGAAVVTATFGAVPCRLFDGAWTRERRDMLKARALAALDMAWPGAGSAVCAAEVIVPADMEDRLGATQGDLDGGEIAPDQMLDLRGWHGSPRTPVEGLYLGSGSAAAGPLGTCAAGAAAARAVLGDLGLGGAR